MLSSQVLRTLGSAARRRVVASCERVALPSQIGFSPDFFLLLPFIKSYTSQFRLFHTSNKLLATHYEILGLSKTSSIDDIRKAYRAKAKQYHPDLNKDPSAQSKFVAVKEAYECLKDSSKRAHYDATLSGFDPLRTARSSQRGAGYQAPQWDFKKAEEKMWHEYRETRHKAWNTQNSKMDEQMRKSDQMEAVRKRLAPLFSFLLACSLAIIGGSALYVQFQDRKHTGPTRHFASEQNPDVPADQQHPKMVYPPAAMDYTEAYPRQYAEPGPNKRYITRWEEVHEAVKRRDEFYRALLRNDDATVAAPQLSQRSL